MAKPQPPAPTKVKAGRRQIKIVSVVVAVALVITVIQCGRQLIDLNRLSQQRNEYKVAYEKVLVKKTELEEQKALLSNNTYLERLAKERFHLIKPNEYLIVPAEENSDVAAEDNVKSSDIH